MLHGIIPDETGACHYARARLERELVPKLIYHSIVHTRDDVVPATERLAAALRLADDERVLLRTAAWFHDIGFVEQRDDHERVSVQIASHTLPRFGYTRAQIDIVAELILATRLPQSPRTMLAAVLADADLDSLGRTDFLATSLALRAELEAFGSPIAESDWYERQLSFLRGHQYWTAAAQALRDPQKRSNIAHLEELTSRSPR